MSSNTPIINMNEIIPSREALNKCIEQMIESSSVSTERTNDYYSKRRKHFVKCVEILTSHFRENENLTSNLTYNPIIEIDSKSGKLLNLKDLLSFFTKYTVLADLQQVDESSVDNRPEIMFLKRMYEYGIEKIPTCTKSISRLVACFPEQAERHPLYSDLEYCYRLLCEQGNTINQSLELYSKVRAGRFEDCFFQVHQTLNTLDENKLLNSCYKYTPNHLDLFRKLEKFFAYWKQIARFVKDPFSGIYEPIDLPSCPEDMFKKFLITHGIEL